MVKESHSIDVIKNFLFLQDEKLTLFFENFEIKQKEKKYSDFQNLVRIIIGQQLSGSAAETIFGRLLVLIGSNFLPSHLRELKWESFLKIGVSRAKASYCLDIAGHLEEHPNFFEGFANLSHQEQITELTKFRGVGIWTASIFIMSSDIFSDIFPTGDGTLNKVISEVYGVNESDVEAISAKWSPFRTLVCNAMWHYQDNKLKN